MSTAQVTDLYEVTMARSYLQEEMTAPATFDLFVRKLPPGRGFLVAAGLESVPDFLAGLRVDEEDVGAFAAALGRRTGIWTPSFSVTAAGSCATMSSGYSSMFVFGEVGGRLGGPPTFVVTGLCAGFGYNSSIRRPQPDQVLAFPFASGLTVPEVAAPAPTSVNVRANNPLMRDVLTASRHLAIVMAVAARPRCPSRSRAPFSPARIVSANNTGLFLPPPREGVRS